jgi:hypothetical protein
MHYSEASCDSGWVQRSKHWLTASCSGLPGIVAIDSGYYVIWTILNEVKTTGVAAIRPIASGIGVQEVYGAD